MGNVIGIVAEYNPFHNGHARLIEQTRAQLGAVCPVVCVMSGDFVQRGSPAVYAKFARAEAAARCGADLVLELPLPWALSSAEGFARGAVGLLGSLGGKGGGGGKAALVAALAPYLHDGRREKLAKAARLAQAAHLAGAMLREEGKGGGL